MKQSSAWRSAYRALLLLFALPIAAQQPAKHLAGPIAGLDRQVLPGSHLPFAKPSDDLGEIPPETRLQGMTLVFQRSQEQQHDLDALVTAQQDSASPQYHQWLTPEQFSTRFGPAEADFEVVRHWLEGQGFTVSGAARVSERITFSGTAAQAAAAFGSPLHRYRTGSTVHFAPNGELSLPSALVPLVTAVLGLSDIKPEPLLRPGRGAPQFTAASGGKHLFSPLDIATQYNINAAYKAGLDGTGQGIAVVSESWLPQDDLTAMEEVVGKGRNSFLPVLVPNTGVAAAYPGAEGEASLDIEYSGLIAPAADLFLVYTGDSETANVYDALAFAVLEDIAPIISVSYGGCEPELSTSQISSFLQLTQQANAQGQTIVAASGDRGATTCYGVQRLSAAQQASAAVDFPADLPTVTGVGGLQLAPGTFEDGTTQYFAASAGGQDAYNTLLSYAPEVIWNEDVSFSNLASGGGGVSSVVPRPAWQSGVPGIPAGNFRLVPDVALQASIESPGFLYCTSDTALWRSGQGSSCIYPGLPSDLTGTYSIAGGTSFDAPIFAGMIAILNQAQKTTGEGNINPTLYSLASQSATYASVFHDVVSGTNQCIAPTSACAAAGQAGYVATAGYDLVSGLGSVDFAQLLAAWPALPRSTTTLGTFINISLPDFNPAAGSIQTVSGGIQEQPYGTNEPQGSVSILLDGKVIQSAVPINARSIQFTYTVPAADGGHVLAVSYPGDSTHAAARASTAFTVGSAQAVGSFRLGATTVSLPYNGTATSTITVTPVAGYNGLVKLGLSQISTSSATTDTITVCYRTGTVSTYAGVASTTLTLGEGTACGSAAPASEASPMVLLRPKIAAAGRDPGRHASNVPPAALAVLLLGIVWRRRQHCRLPVLCGALFLLPFSMGLSGCGGSSTASPPTPITPAPASISLNVTVFGQDSVNLLTTDTTTFVANLVH